jgi:hypothetical protein
MPAYADAGASFVIEHSVMLPGFPESVDTLRGEVHYLSVEVGRSVDN